MPELELIENPKPAEVRPSLLRRLFRTKDIGFYLMIVLAWIGVVYTTSYDLETSRRYWHWLIPAFGVICIITQWNNVEPTLKARSLLVFRQVLHWGAVLALVFLLYAFSTNHGNNITNLIDDRQGSFMMTFTVALSTYLAGLYHDWRLCVVAIFILAGGVVNVAFSNLAPLLVWIGLGLAVLYFIGVWLYSRWQDRQQPSTGN